MSRFYGNKNISTVDKIIEMKSKVHYYIATFLFLIWVLGYLILDLGGVFHLTFLAAVVILILKVYHDFSNLE